MMSLLKYFLLIYVVVYIITVFIWRVYTIKKKIGFSPVVYTKQDNAHNFVGKVFTALIAISVIGTTLYILSDRLHQYMLPINFLDKSAITWAGVLLLTSSLLWTIYSQSKMGKSWRIGIDTKNRTDLVNKGIFALSRNPIYLGAIVTSLGLLLTIPNVLNLVLLILITVILSVQIRLEEEFLLKIHGEVYENYRKKVRRWI